MTFHITREDGVWKLYRDWRSQGRVFVGPYAKLSDLMEDIRILLLALYTA